MKLSTLPRFVFGAALCLLLAAPFFAADDALAASKKPAVESPEAMKKGLENFGKSVADSFNRCVMPNINKKKVDRNDNGTFTATYLAIDPQSINVSYKPAVDPKSPVKYIGTLNYAEVTYTCTAPTKAAALKGPFVASRVMTTELVKYVNGKWSY